MTTTREMLTTCPDCSTTIAYTVGVDPVKGGPPGFKLVDGAWMGRCPDCQAKHIEAANAEHEGLARAAKRIARLHAVGVLEDLTIPEGEGFGCGGAAVYGFWAAAICYTEADFERFISSARRIVRYINEDRDLNLRVNVNGDFTQAIVHGSVES